MINFNFKKWLSEWNDDEVKIRGEYWVRDGYVDFADGDTGDQNHEMIAYQHIVGSYTDEIQYLANELDISIDLDYYDFIDEETIQNAIQQIANQIEENMAEEGKEMSWEQIYKYIREQIGCPPEVFDIILGRGEDPRSYVIEHEGWIAVRSNNIELFGYNQQVQKEVANAIHQILYEEGHQQVNPANVEVTIFDYKSGKHWYATLEELEAPQITPKISHPIRTTYNKTFVTRDREENKYSSPQTGTQNPWNVAAKKAGMGTELWRGTSESSIN